MEAARLRPVVGIVLAILAPVLLPLVASDEPAPSADDLSPTGRPILRDVTVEAGLGGFLHAGYLGPGNLEDPLALFPEAMGPGACWLDHDLDGLLDLFLVNGQYMSEPERNDALDPHSALYRNLGDGTFADVSAASGTDLRFVGQGCAAADYDNDGWPDLLVTGWSRAFLLHNVGGTFEDVTDAAGVRDDVCGDFACWSSSASWFDYDRDGCLDLYVDHFSEFDADDPPPFNGPDPGQVNRLFHGGCDGTFSDVTEAAGLANEKSDTWSSLAADLNVDGWPDLYVCNDGDENDMYLNDQDGTFTRTPMAAVNLRACMGTSIGDPNHDGRWDIAVTNYVGQFNGIFIWQGDDFEDIGGQEPFADAKPWSGWGVHWYDVNNDGHQDLVVVNSFTEDNGVVPALEPMLAYENIDGALHFRSTRTSLGADFQQDLVGRGTAFADYDNDGDLDMVVAQGGEAGTKLFRSDVTGGNFLNVDVVGTASGVTRDAMGARIVVRADGLADQFAVKLAGSGYLGNNDPRFHVGLARAESADVEVDWPDGSVETWSDLPANAFVRLTQGDPAAEIVGRMPVLRVTGASFGQRLETLTFNAEAVLPPGASVESIVWDFGDGRGTATGPAASFAFDDVGGFSVRATVTDSLGRAKTQALAVMVWDDLFAEVAFDEGPILPTDKAGGVVTVTFSDGAPVRGASVVVTVNRSSGNEAVDDVAAMLPRFLRDALGYNGTAFAGTTDAAGAFAFEVPYNIESPLPTVNFDANHVGLYRVSVEGFARGSVFEPIEGSYTVVAALPAMP